MQKVRRHFKKLRQIVSIKFQESFHFLKVFFTFPSRYFSLSVIKIFRLWGWAPNIQTKHDLFRFTK